MTEPIAYGIDFGTTNSAIAIAYEGQAKVVRHGPANDQIVPSVIYMDRSRQRLIGEDAIRQYLVNPSPDHSRLLWSVKYFLADDIWPGTTSPSGEFLEPEDIVAIVLSELKRRADAECGYDVRRVVLGHPVLFAGAEGPRATSLNDLAKTRLQEAGHRAGFDKVSLLEESQAALVGEVREPGLMVSLDFGGGTFDVSIIETDSRGEQRLIASEGVVVGGDFLTELLFDDLLAKTLGYYTPLPRDFYGAEVLPEFRNLHGAVGIVGNDRARRLLDFFIRHADRFPELSTLGEVVLGGHAYPLHRGVDDVKISLGVVAEKELVFRRPGISIDVRACRTDFETMTSGALDELDAAIDRALVAAGLTEAKVHHVVRTGGSSQLRPFMERINRRFGVDKVEQREAFVTVARGLALKALETNW